MKTYSIHTAPTFTRPADTNVYAATDLVANNTTAGSVVALVFPTPGVPFKVIGGRVVKSSATMTNFAPSVYLYSSTITFGGGDNAAPAPSDGGLVGILPMAQVIAGTSHGIAFTTATTTAFPVHSGGPLYGFIVAGGAYTPASAETFSVSLYVEIET